MGSDQTRYKEVSTKQESRSNTLDREGPRGVAEEERVARRESLQPLVRNRSKLVEIDEIGPELVTSKELGAAETSVVGKSRTLFG